MDVALPAHSSLHRIPGHILLHLHYSMQLQTRSNTPSVASSDRDADSTSVKSVSTATSPATLSPPPPAPSAPSQPSPIAESPARERAASQDEVHLAPPTVDPSPLAQLSVTASQLVQEASRMNRTSCLSLKLSETIPSFKQTRLTDTGFTPSSCGVQATCRELIEEHYEYQHRGVFISQGMESREHAVVTTRGSSSSSPQASTSTTLMPPAEPQQTSDAQSTRTIGAPSIAVTTVDASRNPSSIPFPSAEHMTAKTSPRKSSWFGLLSRGKGGDEAAIPSEHTSTPTPPPTELLRRFIRLSALSHHGRGSSS
ncbi:hypothetical protein LshimejAT787_2200740 [Lyophyllum shimeji]|uniref:Uncharacterized protein n=1 Tax=Lyophyllum shimeji TaxID=47721 RepID=A0A9P3Q156_LYOSH|nr:hypothetical protein LshimejAT787_2200740 [Lyophyllum shimeji]